ncbi:MAG: hypothetical protein AAF663_02855 [Planctomycetota bacterium]
MIRRFPTVAEFATPRNACAYFGERGDWFMVDGQHRESDSLTRSNFAVLVSRLEAVDPDASGWAVERFSCSLVGWRDHLLVAPNAKPLLRVAVAAAREVEAYPVLDESHWSDLEWDEASEWWASDPGIREYACEQAGINPAAAECDDLAEAIDRFDDTGNLLEMLRD